MYSGASYELCLGTEWETALGHTLLKLWRECIWEYLLSYSANHGEIFKFIGQGTQSIVKICSLTITPSSAISVSLSPCGSMGRSRQSNRNWHLPLLWLGHYPERDITTSNEKKLVKMEKMSLNEIISIYQIMWLN